MVETHSLEDWEPLPAERKLAESVGTGQIVQIGDGTLPAEDLPEDDPRVIRTGFLRALILGRIKGHTPHEKGVRVGGAYLRGDNPDGEEADGLDLEGCDLPGDLLLVFCRIPDPLLLQSASLRNLFLNDSHLGAGLGGDRLRATGGVFLRGLVAKGEVRLLSAKLGGNLECDGARLTAGEAGFALNLQGARVTGALVLREKATVSGVLNLTGAELGQIVDDLACWPGQGNLRLNRCHYGGFVGARTPVDATSRIRWLSLQEKSDQLVEFWPQPWEECARVLRGMGHEADARAILIEKEKRQRKARRARRWRNGQRLRPALFRAWDVAMGLTTRYGREPLWAFAWLAGLMVIGLVVFAGAQHAAALKPNNAFVLRNAEWVECLPEAERYSDEGSQLACFLEQPEGRGYPAFNPLVYSADALLPIFDLGMQEYWVPDENTGFGQGARVYLWVHVTLGWALSLLAVAGFSGLIRTDNTT